MSHGAQVDAKDGHGWTPLHRPASEGEKAIVELLLSYGAQIDSRDDHGWTPLHCAASEGEEAIVELLLQKGADVQAKTQKGFTALHLLENNPEHLEAARVLLAHKVNLEAVNGAGNTALHVAAQHRYSALVDLLLASGASVDAHGEAGATPLHWAVSQGDADMVSLLLKYHADVNSRDLYRFTPLMQATMLGRKTAAELLLGAGAAIDLDAPAPGGSTVTALSLASWGIPMLCPRLDFVLRFRKSAAGVRTLENLGMTPRHSSLNYLRNPSLVSGTDTRRHSQNCTFGST